MTRAAPATTAPLGVAFSGGVGSSTLLALAARAPGRDEVLANLVGWR
jgi:PP-loop superfamily ATP-utilizing enzyme